MPTKKKRKQQEAEQPLSSLGIDELLEVLRKKYSQYLKDKK